MLLPFLFHLPWWCFWFVFQFAHSRNDPTEITWKQIPLPKKQLRTEDLAALNRHTLNRWAERERHKHRSVNNYRKVVAERSGAYNASIHWKDIHMPRQSYWYNT